MQTDPSSSVSGHVQVGSVLRCGVSGEVHDGEELNSSPHGGACWDRQFAVVDRATGKIGGAKNPRKWGNFFDFRATYCEPPRAGAAAPPGSDHPS